MWTHLKPVLAALWVLAVTSQVTLATTELNLYISKQHLTEYYNSNIGMLLIIVFIKAIFANLKGVAFIIII